MWEGAKSTISLVLGLILLMLGGIPLANQLGILSWQLPSIIGSFSPQVFLYILAAGGLYLIIDVFGEWGEWYGYASLIIGLLFVLWGILELMKQSGFISIGIPGLSPLVYQVFFVVESFFLIIGAWLQS